MSECLHPETFNSMCVLCGRIVVAPPPPAPTRTFSRSSASVIPSGSTASLSPTATAIATASRSILVNGNVVTVRGDSDAGEKKLLSLQRAGKLVLVLDIDHTLLHSVQVDGPTPKQTSALGGQIHHLPIEEVVDGQVKHLVMKKRPFLDEFLRQAHSFCEMSIYTAGTRRYAEAVLRVIDPTGELFAHRLVSRSDGAAIRPDAFRKSLATAFLQEARLAVILDDREDVWQGPQSAQLLLVRAYQFFFPGAASAQLVSSSGAGSGTGMSEAFNAPGGGVVSRQQQGSCPVIRLQGEPGAVALYASPTSIEYCDGDDQLPRCLEILRELHARYFAALRPSSLPSVTALPQSETPLTEACPSLSVPLDAVSSSCAPPAPPLPLPMPSPAELHMGSTLSALKREVLRGCTISFSGVIPTNESHPHQHVLWRLAESLGAQVSLDVLPRTTHLLAVQTNTKKAAQCLQQRAAEVWVLHTDWLVYCRWALCRVQESTFMLSALPPNASFPQPVMNFEPIVAHIAKKRSRSPALENGECSLLSSLFTLSHTYTCSFIHCSFLLRSFVCLSVGLFICLFDQKMEWG
jgi:FCP1-like phosphatase family protein